MPPASAFDWEGQTVVDRGGEKIGTIEEIYLVEETGRPEWALVKIGRLKSHTTLVPLMSAQAVSDGIKVGYAKDKVAEAPEIEAGSEPSVAQVDAMYRYYGIALPDASSGAGNEAQHAPAAATGSNGHGDMRDAPIGDVVKQVSEEAKTLAGQEFKLAKAEVTEKAKEVGIGAGMFGGAGYVAHLAALALIATLIFALAEAMATWLAALIVTVVLAATAGALALMGKKRIQQAGPPVPEEAIESVKQTIETVKEEAKWGLGQTR